METWAKLIQFETTVAQANADIGKLGFVISPNTRSKWSQNSKGAGFARIYWHRGRWLCFTAFYSRLRPVRFQNAKGKASQRAMVAAKLANLARGGDRHSESFKGPLVPLITNAKAADIMNVCEKQVKRARKILNHGAPAIIKQVEEGKMTVRQAARRTQKGSTT